MLRVDFTWLLVFATAFTGVVIILNRMLWHGKGVPPDGKQHVWVRFYAVVLDYSRSFFPVLILVLLLRSFVFEPFNIPSGSMRPNLLVGDFIVVSKYHYGLRLPLSGKKILPTGNPKRGDVVVFRYPIDPDFDYIKRVIGLPGDKIGYHNKKLYINDKLVSDGQAMAHAAISRQKEKLEGHTYAVYLDADYPAMDAEFHVPEGQYFVMGDNRDHSNDSRYWGMVPETNLVGKALFVWMNWDVGGAGLQFSRIGHMIP